MSSHTNPANYLALYTGANGPISVALHADTVREIVATVEADRGAWHDDAADALGLPLHATDREVEAALSRGRWVYTFAVREFSVYRRATDCEVAGGGGRIGVH